MLAFNVISTLFVISAAEHVGTGNNLLLRDLEKTQERSLKKKSIFTPLNIGLAGAGLTVVTAIVVVPILCSTRVIDKNVKGSTPEVPAGSNWFVNYILCPFNSYSCTGGSDAAECGAEKHCPDTVADQENYYCAAGTKAAAQAAAAAAATK